MPEAPTVAPVEAAKPVAPIEAPRAVAPTVETQTAAATTNAINASGDVRVGLDTLAQAAAEGEQRDLDADLAGTSSLQEQQDQFNPDNVDEAAATELGIGTAPKTTEAQTGENTGTATVAEPVAVEQPQDNNATLDTANPTPQSNIEENIQPEPGEPNADKTSEPTKPLEGQQPEPTGEEDRQAEGETPEAQAKRRLEQGLEIAAKVIDLPGLDKGVPKALIEAIKDNPELIDALHGPLSQAESADQLILNLTNELRKQSASENAAAPETPNAPAETPGPQSPAAEGAPSNTPSSSGENSTNNSEAAKKEAEKAQVEKLSKAKKLLIVALLILLGVSLSSVAAIPELK